MEFLKGVMDILIPFVAGLIGLFSPILNNFPDKEDWKRWEALSGIGVADCFCSPVMVNHCTSDILVPVDQISRRYTYAKPGDSLPEDFDTRLPGDFPGKLKCSLEECLPPEETRIERIPVPPEAPESDLPYDAKKRFNLNIFDDGPVEGYGTHSSRMDVGRRRDVPYLKEMLAKSAAKTNVLTPAMLRSLLLRYQGVSIALPAHRDVDDTVYGSLAVYQREIREELAYWTKHHGEAALESVFEKVLAEETEETCRQFRQTMAEIQR